ncbi:TlpA family protein disulfide reductase [Gracilimonas mengyeensis]|uniref:Thiol-disulfide isomerase or thioredoxin n=1 Tax=Gracilimonas mengyeensis TaxID=1302730 RepID=A0A521E1L7_9BACT|nr:TlpA disulfide reductase family protein [Gracilimonas mengyeensis]SMO77846.1 Thiol-disulfide isomerase or thioredoxin [Gracilimonas mengyeensis]
MKYLITVFGVLLFSFSVVAQNNSNNSFQLELPLIKNTGQVPPILAISMGGGYTFEPKYPGEPDKLPKSLKEGKVIHGIIDYYQYIQQGFTKGFIDSATWQRAMVMIDEQTVTDEWVDVIVTVAVGEDENGNPTVYTEDEDGSFGTKNPVYFKPTVVVFQDNNFEVMEAKITARFNYFDGEKIVTHEGLASLMYLRDTPPSESLQLYFNELRIGTWEVHGQRFDIALSKESAPPYRKEPFTYLYIDLDENGIFDVMPDGMESYAVTEPFHIAGESWEISEIAMDGSSVTIVPSAEEVDPKVALRPGTEAPDFTAETLSGSELSLKDLQEKYVLLDFWGTWCGPCIEALPTIKEAYEKYGGEHFEIVGIAYESNLENFGEFIAEENINWPQIPEIFDTNNPIQEMYSVDGYPTYYLLSPDGVIVEYGVALSHENLMGTLAKYLE